jgi:putative inorganic carbon (HCO3(-)) transporter
METSFMALILRRRLPETVQYVLSILLGFLAGALVLLDLPLKWTVALFMMVGFVAILLIVGASKRLLLSVLVLLVPMHIGTGLPALLARPGHVGLSAAIDLQLIDVIVIALLMYHFTRLATHQAEIRLYPSTTVPALAWLVASALSAANARDMGLTLIQVAQMARLLLLYLVVANSIKDETDIKWLVWALLAGALFEGLLGIFQWVAGRPLGLSFLGEATKLFYGRPLGTIGHPNGYGAYLAATIPIGLVLLFSNVQGVHKAFAGIVLGVGILGLVFSHSRGGWLSFAAASIAVLVFALRRRRQDSHTAFVGAGAILLVLLLLMLSQRDLIAARLTSEQGQKSALSRITMAKGAIAMIQDYPMLGVGANNYPLLMPAYDPFDYARERQIVIVHDIYLLIAAETGLIGLAAFLWFLASLYIQTRRLIILAPNDTVWLAGVGAFSALTALTVHGIADYDVIANLTVFRLLWLFAAIVAGLSANRGQERVASDHSQLCESDTWHNIRRCSQVGSRGS